MKTSEKKAAIATRDAEATKNRILEAAEEEFAKGGLLGARTEAIALKTGVTKFMMFYYFKSKEGLYQAVLERALAQRVAAIQKVDIQSSKPQDALAGLVEAILSETGNNNNLPAIFFYEGQQNKGRFYGQIAIASLYNPIIEVLQRGMKEGVFRKVDPLHTAVNIVAMCVFYYCHFENLKHLWPAGTDLMSKKMQEEHSQATIEQVIASVLKH